MKKFVREHSLSLFFGVILLAALAGQSVAGQRVYNADAAEHGAKTISWAHYLVTPEFGGDLLENWQSEFLAVGAMAVFTIYLRQRGSPESKPVGAPHGETASSG